MSRVWKSVRHLAWHASPFSTASLVFDLWCWTCRHGPWRRCWCGGMWQLGYGAGMVASVLGKPLNKAQQCSAWHVRPLSPEQMLYAANDAAVLLALFDAFVAVAPPQRFSVVRRPPGPPPPPGPCTGDGSNHGNQLAPCPDEGSVSLAQTGGLPVHVQPHGRLNGAPGKDLVKLTNRVITRIGAHECRSFQWSASWPEWRGAGPCCCGWGTSRR